MNAEKVIFYQTKFWNYSIILQKIIYIFSPSLHQNLYHSKQLKDLSSIKPFKKTKTFSLNNKKVEPLIDIIVTYENFENQKQN